MTIQGAYKLFVRKTAYSTQIWPKFWPLESDDLRPHWIIVQYCPSPRLPTNSYSVF